MSEKSLRPAVKALVEKEGKILVLTLETDWGDLLVLPGGKVEYGESPRSALKREIREELSCKAKVQDPQGMYHFFVGPDNDGKQIVLTAFSTKLECEKISVDNNPADENITGYTYMRPSEVVEEASNDQLASMISRIYDL